MGCNAFNFKKTFDYVNENNGSKISSFHHEKLERFSFLDLKKKTGQDSRELAVLAACSHILMVNLKKTWPNS